MINNENAEIGGPRLSHIDLAGLPMQLRIELVDFYEFLIKKYHIDDKSKAPQTKFELFLERPIQVSQLEPWTRDELHER